MSNSNYDYIKRFGELKDKLLLREAQCEVDIEMLNLSPERNESYRQRFIFLMRRIRSLIYEMKIIFENQGAKRAVECIEKDFIILTSQYNNLHIQLMEERKGF